MTTPADLKRRVEDALAQVSNPHRGGTVLATGTVRDIAIDDAGAVTFTVVLTRDDPAGLARQARKAVEAVGGVSAVRVQVLDAGGETRAAPPAPRAPAGA
ncbi:MAG: iron-sulfur cluster assembly protein, partial [Gemmatimonadales bacterium]